MGGYVEMNKECENPITEASLEHGLAFCLKYKQEGKTLDDLIEHLETQLLGIKAKKFNKFEDEIKS